MIKKLLTSILAALLIAVGARAVKVVGAPEPEVRTADLEEFDLQPGGWFSYYMHDWMNEHDVSDPAQVTSGIAVGGETGQYIWATATPEWDAAWFAAHGYKFPQRWVPFYFLGYAEGEPGDECRLRGL